MRVFNFESWPAIVLISLSACGLEAPEDEPTGSDGPGEAVAAISQALSQETAVGVTPIDGVTCPNDGDRPGELISLYLDAEDTDTCSKDTGWVLPASLVPAPFCGSSSWPYGTTLSFCKVDGTRFRPITRDPADTSNFYAVLRLGQTCPNGSTPVSKYIDIEDDSPVYWQNSGPYTPNVVSQYAAALYFCLFQHQPNTAIALMSKDANGTASFPKLGTSYAVMHDFAGHQPPWVLSKKYVYEDDEDTHNHNSYTPSSGSSYVNFTRIIGGGANTTFEWAQVR